MSILVYTPHDYQQVFLGDYLRWVDNDANPGDCRLYTSPTGTGKSVMELMALDKDAHAILVTPRLEIIAGMLQKLGVRGVDGWSDEKLATVALAYRITTPVRFRNMLAAGTMYDKYEKACTVAGVEWSSLVVHRIIFDEGHHLLADTYNDIRAYLPGANIVCLTATGFRGTPKETDRFLSIFGGVINQVLSLSQAAARGLFAVPRPEVWPLVDDDTLEVVNGEIRVDSAAEAVGNVLADIVKRCQRFVVEPLVNGSRIWVNADGDVVDEYPWHGPNWDRPTMFAVPSVAVARELAERLTAAGMPAESVTQDTPRAERNEIFRRTIAREIALVQIDVVSEGVDLPIRRLIDLRPTLSPVKWMQQLGRITRPTGSEPPSEYYCTNRNLERHGYLFDGLLPPPAIAAAQQAFGKPTKRAGLRVVGLEGLGKFQGIELPLIGGLVGHMYALTTVDGYKRRDYVALCHPCSSEPIIAARESGIKDDGTRDYGNFRRVERLPDLAGYSSASPKQLTDRQRAWWTREAARFGLDPRAAVNRKNFNALPVLKDLGIALVGGGG